MRFLLALLLILGTIEAARNCKNRYAEARGRDSTQVFQQRYGCKTESQIAEEYWTTVGFDGQLRDGRTTDDFLRFPGDQLNNAFIGYWITRSKYGHSRHYEAFGHVFVKPDGRICGWFVGMHHEVIEVCGGFRVLSRNRRNPQEPIPFEWVQGEQWRNRDVLGFHHHRIAKFVNQSEEAFFGDAQVQNKKFQGISPNSEKFVEVNEPAEFSTKVWLLKKRSHQLPQQHQPAPQNVVQPSGEDVDLQTYNDPHEHQRIAHIKSFPYYDQYGRPSGHHFDSERPAYDSYGRRIPFQRYQNIEGAGSGPIWPDEEDQENDTYDPVPSRGDPDYADWLRRQYELRASQNQNRARPDVQAGVGYQPASDTNSWAQVYPGNVETRERYYIPAPGRSEGQRSADSEGGAVDSGYPGSEGQAGQSEDRDDVPDVRYGSDVQAGRSEVQPGAYPGYQGTSEGQAGRSDASEDRDGSSGRSGASDGQSGSLDSRYPNSEGQAGRSDPRYGSQVYPGSAGASDGQAGQSGSYPGSAGRSDPRYGSQVYPGSSEDRDGSSGRSDAGSPDSRYPGSQGQAGYQEPRYGSQVYPGRSGASEGQAGYPGSYPGSAGSSEGQAGRSDPRYESQASEGRDGSSERSDGQAGSLDSRYPGSEGQAGRSDPRYGTQVYPGTSEGQAAPSDLRQGSNYYWPSGVRKPESARPIPDQSARNLAPNLEDGEIFVPKNADDDEKYRNFDVYGNPINSAGPVRLARVKPQIIVRDRAGRTYRPWTDPTTGKITYIYESKSGNDRNVELPDDILPDIERQLEAQRRRQYLENELRGEIQQGAETQRRKDSSAQNPRHRRRFH